MKFVFLGLSISSSWGNGHATTYRGLVRELGKRGHDVLFLERNLPWYAENRDMPQPPGGRTEIYRDVADLQRRFGADVASADFVTVGSFVPDGIAVSEWVLNTATGGTSFYDIDTPVTLAKLRGGGADHISRALVPRFDLYLSFTGGPTLQVLQREFGARSAKALYCSVDPDQYFPETARLKWDLGYLGTYSEDRQSTLERLLLDAARASRARPFVVAGPQYPEDMDWPPNVERIYHLNPRDHRRFYNAQRFTLNVTRADMIRAGYSPSVRLFEAAACATPIISDPWEGLETVLTPGEEILIARTTDDVLRYLRDIPEAERRALGARARARVLRGHTAAHRAQELEDYAREVLGRRPDVGESAVVETSFLRPEP